MSVSVCVGGVCVRCVCLCVSACVGRGLYVGNVSLYLCLPEILGIQ